MAQQNIGSLHATVTANAAQFVNEFQRADNAARRHGVAIRNEVSNTVEKIGRKFSGTQLAGGLLGAFGLGSGAAVMGLVVDKFADMFAEAKKDAEDLAKYFAEALKSGRELSELRLQAFTDAATPGAAGQAIESRLALLRKQLATAEADRATAIGDLAAIGGMRFGEMGGTAFDPLKGKYGWGSQRMMGDKASAAEQAAAADAERLRGAIDKWQKALDDIKKKKLPESIDKALDDFFKPLDDMSKAAGDKLDRLAEQFKSKIATPYDKLLSALDDIASLRAHGMITDQQAERGFGLATAQFGKDTEPNMKAWERAAGVVKADDMTRRGLGSGADYARIGETQTSILTEIRDLLRRGKAGGLQPAFSD